MKVTLLKNEWEDNGSPIQRVLYNRGLTPVNIKHYLETTDEDIYSPKLFGKKLLDDAAAALAEHISRRSKILVIVDSDCDGYTSAAIIINYLYKAFPTTNIKYFLHSGKQHGLSDCLDIAMNYDLIICPDSSSNDFEAHKALKEAGKDIIILDHHDAKIDPTIYKEAIIINNQLSEYPNKELSGAGVTWQFCRYLDNLLNKNYANDLLDLVALGNCGDMESMLEIETKHLIFKGFKEENIKNPFIFEMANKNSFSLNKSDYKPSDNNDLLFTPIGAAFFIVPFINAINRSGTLEEKDLIFRSMLEAYAFTLVPSNKRGHKEGDTERVVDQALRTCTNVKNRQTKVIDEGMELLEHMIQERDLMKNKALIFLLERGQIDRNIAGLAANKIMSKYQRPVCVLTRVEEEDGRISYQGSARGCDIIGVTDFKSICAAAPSCIFAEGHPGAFGLGLGYDYQEAEEVQGDWYCQFVDHVNEALKDMPSEPCYYVDYMWDMNNIQTQAILDIACLNDYIGRNFERPIVCIENVKVNQGNFTVMKSNTLKYTLPNVNIIQFNGTEEEINRFSLPTAATINMVCKCCINEWNGNIYPQLQVIDYEIVETEEQNNISEVASSWGF